MKTLTVFTPAYNRARTIGRTYESLCRQTSKDFEWLVVDDGSTDNTRQLVEKWIAERKIDIRYIYQENQGMHGAHNTAYRNIHTLLNTCVDSDDWMPDDAVETIVSFWKEHGSDKHAGIIGLDCTQDGTIIGSEFPDNLESTTLRAYYELHGGRGDKKCVYRTDLISATPEYPVFKDERYVGLGYRCSFVDQKCELLTLNKVLVIVEYQAEGSTMNMWRQYWRNPRGFSVIRRQDMEMGLTWKKRWTACIHYVSHSLRARNRRFLSESPRPWLTVLAIAPGIALFLVTWWKGGRGKNLNQ
ncbi:MAG: glycosyltransferase family 2 protein [Bacteroidales bacterium]|jgi:glycosyltransferase involved in cell wall biosynthesis|nr:glycosyltransferase family 2 protein [Bacteroidales bacterium]MCH3939900.1 glycosyltransferase family 2 protein [Bacteroidales bacterium]MCI2135226.1 glycosyltransferase family 2 protein [Bacteroidales bacterium]MDY6319611.1 glycosyltransferase family 2 protein [Bacteroidales bacterium]